MKGEGMEAKKMAVLLKKGGVKALRKKNLCSAFFTQKNCKKVR